MANPVSPARSCATRHFSDGGHPERYRRNWQLIAGELQHFGGDSIANTLRRHGKFYRAILLDVCKRLKAKVDKQLSTPQIEQQLLAHFLQHSWNKLNAEQKRSFSPRRSAGAMSWTA